MTSLRSMVTCNLLLLAFCSSARVKYRCSIDMDRPIHITNPYSPSVATGLVIIQYGWVNYFNDTKFMTLARALGPSYFRVGGTKCDVTTFVPDQSIADDIPGHRRSLPACNSQSRNEEAFNEHRSWAEKMDFAYENELFMYGYGTTFKPVTLKASDWRQLNDFCLCVGWKLIFDLNLQKRDEERWNSTNAEQLLNYTEYKYEVDWELGNEPNWYPSPAVNMTALTAEQVAEGFLKLRTLLDKSTWWQTAKVFGPDTNNVGTKSALKYVTTFLERAHQAVDGITFHQYYLNGRTATESDFLNPDVLAKIANIEPEVQLIRELAPSSEVWLGETASAYGSGAPGLSNSYLDGFTWLDKLGMTSKMGVDMVVRQTFFNGRYALINDSFDPMPDYWLTLLYKTLVGSEVLNLTMQSCTSEACSNYQQKYVRVYAHCTKARSGYPRGSVVLYFLNLSSKSQSVALDISGIMLQSAYLYLLETAVPGNLTSREVKLNGVILRLGGNFSLPLLSPVALHPQSLRTGLRIPSHSYGFLVLSNTNAAACFVK